MNVVCPPSAPAPLPAPAPRPRRRLIPHDAKVRFEVPLWDGRHFVFGRHTLETRWMSSIQWRCLAPTWSRSWIPISIGSWTLCAMMRESGPARPVHTRRPILISSRLPVQCARELRFHATGQDYLEVIDFEWMPAWRCRGRLQPGGDWRLWRLGAFVAAFRHEGM